MLLRVILVIIVMLMQQKKKKAQDIGLSHAEGEHGSSSSGRARGRQIRVDVRLSRGGVIISSFPVKHVTASRADREGKCQDGSQLVSIGVRSVHGVHERLCAEAAGAQQFRESHAASFGGCGIATYGGGMRRPIARPLL